MIKFIIPIAPTTKKNSSQIFTKKTKTGKIIPFIVPSEKFKQYQQECTFYMPDNKTLHTPINIKAIYYMPTKRRVDITNLHSALHDILVYYKVIEDDNCTIVTSTDGSRVSYDKENPRTEVEITASDYNGDWQRDAFEHLLPTKPKKKLRRVTY